ncbi:MAG: hypothetical protein JKP98_06345 [Rhodobacteraceae bacterium]|nr:hypothetical protein [Paracoccaceae bacterium]
MDRRCNPLSSEERGQSSPNMNGAAASGRSGGVRDGRRARSGARWRGAVSVLGLAILLSAIVGTAEVVTALLLGRVIGAAPAVAPAPSEPERPSERRFAGWTNSTPTNWDCLQAE